MILFYAFLQRTLHPPPALFFGIVGFSSHLSRPYNDTCRTPPPPAGIVLSGLQNFRICLFHLYRHNYCCIIEKCTYILIQKRPLYTERPVIFLFRKIKLKEFYPCKIGEIMKNAPKLPDSALIRTEI